MFCATLAVVAAMTRARSYLTRASHPPGDLPNNAELFLRRNRAGVVKPCKRLKLPPFRHLPSDCRRLRSSQRRLSPHPAASTSAHIMPPAYRRWSLRDKFLARPASHGPPRARFCYCIYDQSHYHRQFRVHRHPSQLHSSRPGSVGEYDACRLHHCEIAAQVLHRHDQHDDVLR